MCEINQLIHALVYSDWKQIVSYYETEPIDRKIRQECVYWNATRIFTLIYILPGNTKF